MKRNNKNDITGDKMVSKPSNLYASNFDNVFGNSEELRKQRELDEKIKEMINIDKPVIFDCVVDKVENCYPMIPSGKPHNQMLLGPEDEKEEVSDEGKTLV